MPLTDTGVRNTKRRERPQKLTDGGGLHLLVNPNGARYWRMAYRYQGRQKTLALGIYPTVSLADARMARDAAKKLLARDIDPSQARKKQKRRRMSLRGETGTALPKSEYVGHQTPTAQPGTACQIESRVVQITKLKLV